MSAKAEPAAPPATPSRATVVGMAAEPLPDVPEDPEDPRVILRGLPEREREPWLAQYREALEAARDPAGFPRLTLVLRVGRLRAAACGSPGFYERTGPARAREPGTPAEDIFPDWDQQLAAARERAAARA